MGHGIEGSIGVVADIFMHLCLTAVVDLFLLFFNFAAVVHGTCFIVYSDRLSKLNTVNWEVSFACFSPRIEPQTSFTS